MEIVKDTRAPRRLVGRLAIAGVLGAALATFGFVGTAAADTINYTGQGANRDGTCGEFEGSPPAPGGTQTWQFNLTATDGPATMSATFSDGTSVTNVPDDSPPENVDRMVIQRTGPGQAFEIFIEGALRRGEVSGLPQMLAVLPGQYTGSGWGIDRIGISIDKSGRVRPEPHSGCFFPCNSAWSA